jgi:hypothetical protein
LAKNSILDNSNNIRLRAKRVRGKTAKATLFAKQECKPETAAMSRCWKAETHLLALEILTKHILNNI